MSCRLFSILLLCSIGALLSASNALACGGDGAANESDQGAATEPEAPASPAPAPETPSNATEFTTLQVDGVTCGSCLIPIRRELKALKGVKEIQSGADIKEVIVSYMPGSVSAKQLVEAIKKAGYEAVVKGAAPPAKT